MQEFIYAILNTILNTMNSIGNFLIYSNYIKTFMG